jgi:ATP adenylyltransferase
VDGERIWAPWRLAYLARSGAERSEGGEPQPPTPAEWPPGADQGCFMCRAAARHDANDADRRLLVVARTEHCVGLLNRYPYNNGHLLVCPRRHVGDLASLGDVERLAALDQIDRLTGRLTRLLNPEGFNVGINLGRAAGAGVPGHLHWHVVPRWTGDSNFMHVTADVRVISQSLDALWEAMTEIGGIAN